jgi:hypothetical protein
MFTTTSETQTVVNVEYLSLAKLKQCLDSIGKYKSFDCDACKGDYLILDVVVCPKAIDKSYVNLRGTGRNKNTRVLLLDLIADDQM